LLYIKKLITYPSNSSKEESEGLIREIMGTLEIVERNMKKKYSQLEAQQTAQIACIPGLPAQLTAETVCGNCQRLLRSGAKFCPNCGTTVAAAINTASKIIANNPANVICPFCNATIKPNAKFCPGCGVSLKK